MKVTTIAIGLLCQLRCVPIVTRPPVVIIIEDFEAFQPNIVQDLILQLR